MSKGYMRILCYTERLTGRSVLYDPFIIKVRKESKVMAARAWRLGSSGGMGVQFSKISVFCRSVS